MDVEKVWKNWPVHNFLGHPLMQLLRMLGLKKTAIWVHNVTCPDMID